MEPYVLRLFVDAVGRDRTLRLRPVNRVLYVREGAVSVVSGERRAAVTAAEAWHGAAAGEVTAGPAGATVLRWELARDAAPAAGPVLEHALDLDPRSLYLMRCDRVEFAPAGVAHPHRHRGGGIRYLLSGALEVTVGEAPPRLMRPGDAWFESGREPVLAVAAAEGATSFVRCSILPREIRGATSILYVDPADAQRGRPRTYTVYVDEPIAIV